MSEFTLYRKWAILIERRKNWSGYKEWSNYEFTTLSNEISEKSETQISRNTIRNVVESIIDEDKNYTPQTATKDALAQYVGYKNWESYKSISAKRKRLYRLCVLLGIAFLCGAIFLIYSIFNNTPKEFTFSITNPVGAIPHSVNCKYDISKVKSDDIKVDFGHIGHRGNYLLKDLKKDKKQITQIFHFPDLYRIRVFIDGEVHFVERVQVFSDGWFIYAADASNAKREIPEIIVKAKHGLISHIALDAVFPRMINSEGYFYIPKRRIRTVKGLSPNYNIVLRNIQPFEVPVRDSRLTVRFKNQSFGEGSFCSEATLALIGSERNISFRLVEKGCEYYANYRVGEKTQSGKMSDELPFLVLDFSDFKTVAIESAKTAVKLIIDNNEVFQLDDSQDLGELMGIQLKFKGSPHIDFVTLKKNSGEVLFEDDFNN